MIFDLVVGVFCNFGRIQLYEFAVGCGNIVDKDRDLILIRLSHLQEVVSKFRKLFAVSFVLLAEAKHVLRYIHICIGLKLRKKLLSHRLQLLIVVIDEKNLCVAKSKEVKCVCEPESAGCTRNHDEVLAVLRVQTTLHVHRLVRQKAVRLNEWGNEILLEDDIASVAGHAVD